MHKVLNNMERNTVLPHNEAHPFRFVANVGHFHTTAGKIKLAIMILPSVSVFLMTLLKLLFSTGYNQDLWVLFVWALVATVVPLLGFLRYIILDYEKLPCWYQYRMLKSELITIFFLLVVYAFLAFPVEALHFGVATNVAISMVCGSGLLFLLIVGIYTWIRMERMEIKLCGEAHQKNNALPVHFLY